MQPSSPPNSGRKPFFHAGRVWDAFALAVLVFLVWKLVVAPRSFAQAQAYAAPRVSYATLDGPRFTLASHGGRVVFLDFFASWCEPCRLSLPMVERFARNHPEVDVVPIDVGEPPFVVRDFAKKYHLSRVALDPNMTSHGLFHVQGFPTMVVVDAHDRVRATWSGFNPAIQLNMAHAAHELAR